MALDQPLTKPQEVVKTVESLGSEQDATTVNKKNMVASHPTECMIKYLPNETYPDITNLLHDSRPENVSKKNEECSIKILGISWNVETDEFEYDLNDMGDYARTLPVMKRSVLRLAKIFDPLGFLAPFTIVIKMLFQVLCMQHHNWDDPLVGELLCAWN